jgi:diaminohydroxyphosphoribosylaminopyrimidine deaminase/5-amino-6-(5-phosphoribosylamino)uracil reductase
MDDVWMRRALELAARGTGLASPNPLVGAVVIRDGEVVGEGWHEGPGTPHAEIVALDAAGDRARGATLYLTLEPCAHHGRTPPCAPRVVAAGVGRVVTAMQDPNPLVDGRGLATLHEAGVDVSLGVLEADAFRLNEAFVKHLHTGLPFVTLKMAASLDGKVAARDGSSRWITGEEARAEVHRMRGAADAVMVGAGTVVRDDPSLTVRLPGWAGRPPSRIIVDGRGIVPETSKVFTDGLAPTLVVTTHDAPVERRRAWERSGSEVLVMPGAGASLVPLDSLLTELGKRDVQRLLLEGGPTLNWEAVRSGLVDEIVFYVAPVLVGGEDAPSILMGDGIPTIADGVPLDIREVSRIGSDVKVVARVHRDR